MLHVAAYRRVLALLSACTVALFLPVDEAAARSFLSLSPPAAQVSLARGSTATFELTLRSFEPDDVDVSFSTTDLVAAQDPSSFASPGSRSAGSASSWVSLPSRRATLHESQTLQVTARVRVPRDARPGVHAVAILVSREMSLPATNTDGSAHVTVTGSLASELLITIPGAAVARAQLVAPHGPRVVWSGQRPVFSTLLKNRGDTLVVANGRFDTGAFTGIAPARVQIPETLVLPDGARRLTARWNDPPLLGWFHPRMFINAGPAGELEARFPTVFVLPPWWVMALAIAAVALPIYGAFRRRRNRRRHIQHTER